MSCLVCFRSLRVSFERPALPLCLAENGTLTTEDTGAQALQITQSNRTVAPLFRDGSNNITTRTTATRVAASELLPLASVAPVVPIQFDPNGNKATTRPLLETGYQLQGYQQYGYFSNGTVKSTTNIGTGYSIVQTFHDEISVPLYIQIIQGRSPIETAIAMMPFYLTVFFTAMLIIKLYQKLTPRQIGRYGFALSTVALLWLAWVVRNDWGAPVVMIGLILFGIGQGSLVTLLFNVLVTGSPKELAGDVGSLRGTTNNLAAAVT